MCTMTSAGTSRQLCTDEPSMNNIMFVVFVSGWIIWLQCFSSFCFRPVLWVFVTIMVFILSVFIRNLWQVFFFFTEPQKCWWCALIQQCAFRKSPKICISCPVEGADKFIHWLQNPSFNKCRIVKKKRGKSLTNELHDGNISELSATSCRLRLHPQDIMITTAEPLRLWLLDILTEMLKNMIEGTGRTFIRKPVTAVGAVI